MEDGPESLINAISSHNIPEAVRDLPDDAVQATASIDHKHVTPWMTNTRHVRTEKGVINHLRRCDAARKVTVMKLRWILIINESHSHEGGKLRKELS